jgi:hypothetical protein
LFALKERAPRERTTMSELVLRELPRLAHDPSPAQLPARIREHHMVDHDHSLHAPQLLDIEVLGALRRLVSSGDASATRAGDAVTDLLDLPIARYPHEVLVPRNGH